MAREHLVAAGLNEPWVNRAKRCSHCALFYSVEYEEGVTITTPRGWFEGNGLMEKENWDPYEKPVPRRYRP